MHHASFFSLLSLLCITISRVVVAYIRLLIIHRSFHLESKLRLNRQGTMIPRSGLQRLMHTAFPSHPNPWSMHITLLKRDSAYGPNKIWIFKAHMLGNGDRSPATNSEEKWTHIRANIGNESKGNIWGTPSSRAYIAAGHVPLVCM
jgi:hypothetical protein